MKTLLNSILLGAVLPVGDYRIHLYNDNTLGLYKTGSGLVTDPEPGKAKPTVTNLRALLKKVDALTSNK